MQLWLPPDCETVEMLFLKLIAFHDEQARVIHRGKKHIKKHIAMMEKAKAAAMAFAKQKQ